MHEMTGDPVVQVAGSCPPDNLLVTLLSADQPVENWLAEHVGTCSDCQTRLDRLSDTSPLCELRDQLPAWQGPQHWLDAPLHNGDLGTLEGIAIEALIGGGGMGVVYRGRDQRLGRAVAVKFLRQFDGGPGVERFLRESRAAARLSHDHLVPVYSSGLARDGRPWLVMPLIEGESLRERIAHGTLESRVAASITREIAIGLAAVHAAGLVHRDVKPANILLDRQDGRAKLTDFGLVRAETDATLTGTNVLCGTPEYMSPEQASDPASRDPRTDIYSLGITLYECLTGSTPFRGRPLDVLEQHRSADPAPPSQLNRLVPSDLETICLKAMAREPLRRYATANELADDLGRWLAGDAILARPAGPWERAGRWAARNRTPVLAASVVAGTLAVATVASGWFAWRAGEARRKSEHDAKVARTAEEVARSARSTAEIQRVAALQAEIDARRSASRAEETLSTLIEAFRAADPERGATGDLSARELLLVARDSIRSRLNDDPAGRIRLLSGLGESLANIGELEEAAAVFGEAHALSLAVPGFDQAASLSLLASQGIALTRAGRHEQALPILEEAFARQTEVAGPSDAGRLQTGIGLANTLAGLDRLEEAVATIGPVASECEHSLGESDGTTWFAWDSLAAALENAGNWDDAHVLYRKAADARLATLGSGHPQTLASLDLLANNENRRGHIAEAVRIAREVVEGRTRVLGAEHPDTLSSMSNLGHFLLIDGRLPESQEWLSRAVALLRKRPPGPELWVATGNLANACSRLGQFDEAVELHEEALAAKREVLGPGHSSTIISFANLIATLSEAGENERAGELGAECLALSRKTFGPEHPTTLVITNNVAAFLGKAGKTAEALALHRENLRVLERVNGPEHPDTARSVDNIAICLQQLDDLEAAIEMGQQAVRLREQGLGPDHPDTLGSLRNLAESLRRTGQFDQAIRLGRDVVERERKRNGPEAAGTVNGLWKLSRMELEAMDFQAARASCSELVAIFRGRAPDSSTDLAWALLSLAEAEAGLGELDRVQELVDEVESSSLADPFAAARIEGLRGLLAAKADQPTEAERLLIASFNSLDQQRSGLASDRHWYIKQAAGRVAGFFLEQGQPGKAAEWSGKQ